MTLAEAISTLAVAGCRMVPDDVGGMALVVPEGKTVCREVLEVLRAHREQLAAVHAPAVATPRRADDLAEYLREKGLAEPSVQLVVDAAQTFNVPGQAITLELPDADADPAFFEPGIPMETTIETEWHKPGSGYFTVPAGTVGLLIPQVWAIADDNARHQVENTIADAKRRGEILHVPVWLAGAPRALEMNAITIEGVHAPAGMDLLPWRSPPGDAA